VLKNIDKYLGQAFKLKVTTDLMYLVVNYADQSQLIYLKRLLVSKLKSNYEDGSSELMNSLLNVIKKKAQD
jgi:hypothetical protein